MTTVSVKVKIGKIPAHRTEKRTMAVWKKNTVNTAV